MGWAHWIRKNDLTTKISVQLGSRKYSPISCVQVTHFFFEINLPYISRIFLRLFDDSQMYIQLFLCGYHSKTYSKDFFVIAETTLILTIFRPFQFSKTILFLFGLSKKRPLWSKTWSRSEKNVLKKYALPTTLRFRGGGWGWGGIA